jgi:hypothetical protein
MTVENEARTIRFNSTVAGAGLESCLSREPDLGSGRSRFFWQLMSTKTIEIVE